MCTYKVTFIKIQNFWGLSNDSRTIPWIFIKLNVDYILVSTCIQMYKKQREVKWKIN